MTPSQPDDELHVHAGLRLRPTLLARLRDADLDWGGTVQFGTVLTGEKLIDSFDFRESLRALEPEAVGGEMEGAGLHAAAYLTGKDWIIAKAICDWADGKKSEDKQTRQARAARNAAEFIAHAVDSGRMAPAPKRAGR